MTEKQLPPSWSGSVVLDIGGHVGALVLNTTEVMNGREIELIDTEGLAATHSEVRPRHLQGRTLFAAVYPALPEGTYIIAESDQHIVIEGGRVTEVELGTVSTEILWGPGNCANDPTAPCDRPNHSHCD